MVAGPSRPVEDPAPAAIAAEVLGARLARRDDALRIDVSLGRELGGGGVG